MTYLRLLALLEESLLAGLLGLLLPRKVLVVANLLERLAVEPADVNLGLGRDHVSCVDSSERDAVDLEGAGDQQETLCEGLEEHDALAAEAASQEDEDGAGLQRSAGLVCACGLANLLI